jgi:hypothetical protein
MDRAYGLAVTRRASRVASSLTTRPRATSYTLNASREFVTNNPPFDAYAPECDRDSAPPAMRRTASPPSAASPRVVSLFVVVVALAGVGARLRLLTAVATAPGVAHETRARRQTTTRGAVADGRRRRLCAFGDARCEFATTTRANGDEKGG